MNKEVNFEDIIGQKFNKLTVMALADKRNNIQYYECKCDCGGTVIVGRYNLTKYAIQSCGCARTKVDYNDIVGQKFGDIIVVKYVGKTKNTPYYECLCSCGNITKVARTNLLKGRTRSCGCKRNENMVNTKIERYGIKEPQMCSYCGKKLAVTRGVCGNCYRRLWKYGTPELRINRAEIATNMTPKTERGKKMAEMYASGMTYEQIGKEFGVSRQRVGMILKGE